MTSPRRADHVVARAIISHGVADDGAVADLIVVTGPPGAGKSTVARALAARFELSALLLGDDFFGYINRGWVEPWTEQADQQNQIVLLAAGAAAGRFTTGGYTVIYDGIVGPWSLSGFTAATALAELHYVVLLPDERRCLDRVTSRAGHGFTDLDAARHMYRQFVTTEVDVRHVLTDPGDVEATASTIASLMAQGSLVHRAVGA